MTYKQIVRFFNKVALELGNEYGVSDSIVMAVITQESAGNVFAESICGARGLMQIMTPALSDFNTKSGFERKLTYDDMFFEPLSNIRVGAWYLGWLISQFNGNVHEALRAYNVGIGTVKKGLNLEAGVSYAESVLKHESRIVEILNSKGGV